MAVTHQSHVVMNLLLQIGTILTPFSLPRRRPDVPLGPPELRLSRQSRHHILHISLLILEVDLTG